MQRNHIVTAALAGGLTIGAASSGYVIAQFVPYSGHNDARQYRVVSPATSAASTPLNPPVPGPSSPSATPGSSSTFSDPSLAQFIARKAGTSLAGRAPQNVSLSRVKALAEQDPAGASVDTPANTITFYTTSVSFTVVAIAPGKPDMTFTVAGLTNPAIIVPRGARITARFINNDMDEAHGWLITDSRPPFGFGQPTTPAIAGAFAGVIGDPAGGNDGASTISFVASDTGSYDYICPMPGHAQMGMHGSFIVR